MSGEAVESSLGLCKLDHGGLEPNAIAIYEEVLHSMLPLIHSSHIHICIYIHIYIFIHIMYVYIHIYIYLCIHMKKHIHDLLLGIFIPTQWFLSSNKKTSEKRRVLESSGFDWGHQDGFFQGKVSLESTDFTEGGTNHWMDEFWWSTPRKWTNVP